MEKASLHVPIIRLNVRESDSRCLCNMHLKRIYWLKLIFYYIIGKEMVMFEFKAYWPSIMQTVKDIPKYLV